MTIQHDITNYATWCENTWYIKDKKNNLFICMAGFAGESGEIAEEILNNDNKNLLKECGDFFYYWTRVNQLFNYNIDTIEYTLCNDKNLYIQCLEFHKNVGKVCEILKKSLSHNMPIDDTLKDNLQKCLNSFMTIAHFYNYDLDDIISTNIDKIEQRMLKGTLLGNGNDR